MHNDGALSHFLCEMERGSYIIVLGFLAVPFSYLCVMASEIFHPINSVMSPPSLLDCDSFGAGNLFIYIIGVQLRAQNRVGNQRMCSK